MSCTLCTKRGIPCIFSLTTTNTCNDCRQAHKKCSFVVRPFRPHGQRSSHPRHPCEDSFVVHDDESIPEWEWTPGPQTGRRERFPTISSVPPSIDLSTPLLGHHPMGTSLLDRSENKTHQIPPNKTHLFHVCLASKPRGNPLQAQVAPDGRRTYPVHNEPRMPGPSPVSEPPEDILTQPMEEPFGKSSLLFLYYYQLFLTPTLTISSSSRYFLLCNHHRSYARQIPPPHSSSPTPPPSPHVTPPSTPTLVPSQCPREPGCLLSSFPR
ncbi:hypothetical protein O181_020298 [Austropuccinia psidii MF-1]|uniref:Zn(2)-C6 fungal-type domain-containing protein n=1 Tax=Austropuccinia psidii MF-1 TaxID=1389203 RepID=A0A9Q3CCN2_9BASI|nr:hypothetical protein [Austropuccinia psidii MF-1]